MSLRWMTTRMPLLGVLALMLLGSLSPALAHAEAGPFWHERETGTKGEGEIPIEVAPAVVKGEGGEQTFKSSISKTPIEITSKSLKVTGGLYDEPNQGLAHLELHYVEPKVIKPELKGCEVKIGENNNTIKLYGGLAWKWNGTKEQLTESPVHQGPDLILSPAELKEEATELPVSQFTTLAFKGAGCSVLAGTFKMEGSQSAEIKPGQIEEFSKSTKIVPIAGKQHFWNSKAAIGVTPELKLAGEPVVVTGGFSLEVANREVDLSQEGGPMVVSTTGNYAPSESAAENHTLTFKNSVGGVAEEVKCASTKYTQYLRRRQDWIPAFPKFNEGMATCIGAGGLAEAEIEPRDSCLVGFGGFARVMTGEYKGTYYLEREINNPLDCEIIIRRGFCERGIGTQFNPFVTTQNLSGELLIKIKLTGIEDTATALCPEGEGAFKGGEYKGALRFRNLEVRG